MRWHAWLIAAGLLWLTFHLGTQRGRMLEAEDFRAMRFTQCLMQYSAAHCVGQDSMPYRFRFR